MPVELFVALEAERFADELERETNQYSLPESRCMNLLVESQVHVLRLLAAIAKNTDRKNA